MMNIIIIVIVIALICKSVIFLMTEQQSDLTTIVVGLTLLLVSDDIGLFIAFTYLLYCLVDVVQAGLLKLLFIFLNKSKRISHIWDSIFNKNQEYDGFDYKDYYILGDFIKTWLTETGDVSDKLSYSWRSDCSEFASYMCKHMYISKDKCYGKGVIVFIVLHEFRHYMQDDKKLLAEKLNNKDWIWDLLPYCLYPWEIDANLYALRNLRKYIKALENL